MIGEAATALLGRPTVLMTNGRGLNPDELADMALAKLVSVGPDVGPEIRAQVERVRILLRHYMAQAQKSQNTTIYNVLEQAGHAPAAALVRSL